MTRGLHISYGCVTFLPWNWVRWIMASELMIFKRCEGWERSLEHRKGGCSNNSPGLGSLCICLLCSCLPPSVFLPLIQHTAVIQCEIYFRRQRNLLKCHLNEEAEVSKPPNRNGEERGVGAEEERGGEEILTGWCREKQDICHQIWSKNGVVQAEGVRTVKRGKGPCVCRLAWTILADCVGGGIFCLSLSLSSFSLFLSFFSFFPFFLLSFICSLIHLFFLGMFDTRS